MKAKKTAVSLAIGSAFAVSLTAIPTAQAENNPFAMQQLQNGYVVADAKDAKGMDGKCGGKKADEMKAKDGKCGNAAKMKDGKCGEGKCGGAKKADDMKATDKKMPEGKCGEGKCGGKKADPKK